MEETKTKQIKEIFSLSEVLSNIGSNSKYFNGLKVKMNSQRYYLFRDSGVVCVKCKIAGTHFKLKKQLNEDKGHFNLFTDCGRMMTKDHIIPRSIGGANTMKNYQVMCCKCNKEKDSSLSKEDLFKGQIKENCWISENQIAAKNFSLIS